MKKLYIPISTLNFNNILSSESISPKAFYSQRGFGYPRWTEIPENNAGTAILLYEKPFRFKRPESDMEDHPMLIEICTDEDFPSMKNGIFYSDHTIYLSPWRTKFIFFSEQDKNVALSMSNNSLETKLVGLYKMRMVVENYETIKYVLDKCPNVKLNNNAMNLDYRINKMKGLLYGYYIGALLSESPMMVKKYNILQELQNIFSAILSSGSKEIALSYKKERLNTLLSELQKSLPIIAYLQSKLANPQEIEEVINQCVKYGTNFDGLINKKSIIESLLKDLEGDNPASNWLEREWAHLEHQVQSERKLLQVGSEIIVTDCIFAKISNKWVSDIKENELMKVWVNEVLISHEYNGKISLFKKELSDKITLKAKEVYGERWDDSSQKQMLNQMRRYVQGQESTFQWHNYLISSIAAVITKGESWDILLTFMKSKEMYDYRLAFAFYGELHGFANLTRDFTDNLYNLADRQYVTDVYKELYEQLLGVAPTVQLINGKVENTTTDKNAISKASNRENFPQKEMIWNAWLEIRKEKTIKKKDELEGNLKLVLEQTSANDDIYVVLRNLDKNIWKRNNKPWKRLHDQLGIRYLRQKEMSLRRKDDNLSLFNNNILNFDCLKSFPENALKRIQDNWNYTAKEKGYMTDEHINYFINLCKKEGRGESDKHKELKDLFTEETAKSIQNELK